MSVSSEQLYFNSPYWIQNILVSAYGYKLYRKRYTGIYKKIREEIEAVKSLSKNSVRDLQNERLNNMAIFCQRNIPYYQSLFEKLGFNASDITRIEDLQKIPILTKQTLRENGHLFRPKNGVKPFITQHTSGSTGTPLVLDLNEHTYKLAMALLVAHEESHGVTFGEKRATFAGRMLKPSEDMTPPFCRFNRAENQMIFSSYHLNAQSFHFYRNELNKFQPKEIIGYPSSIANLASQFEMAGEKPNFTPTLIVTNSETLLHWQRETIERVFSCPIFDYYGTAEYVTFAGQDKDGIYRPSPLLGITEFKPSELKDGTGSIIATSLTNTAMPLLRYELGDIATIASSTQQLIGTPEFLSIDGRQDDYVETQDGRLVGRIDHIFKGVLGIKEAQVIQQNAGEANVIVVKDGSGTFSEELLLLNIKKRLGNDFGVNIVYQDSIPRSKNGKFKSVLRKQP